jgi:putative zinc finger/helix-turn-helix YgiT family protein
MTTELLFEYPCPECGRGTVKTMRVHNYKTRIKGYPLVIDEAVIGVCDHCQAESFAPEEKKRWEGLSSRSLEARQAFLSPREIAELRKALGLSMEDFARLIGSTRQSISMWEKANRTYPPLRTAELLMKLVRQSLQSGPVDVLTFLLEEARKWGVIIEVRRSLKHANENGESILRVSKNNMHSSDQEKD